MTDPSVLTVVSCGGQKQDLDPGETVPARELYTSSVHTCKDRYGRHSDGYYIMSAKYGLVHHEEELPEYDRTLDDMGAEQVSDWGSEVSTAVAETVEAEGYDAVVLIGSETYVEALEPLFDMTSATVLTPWQTDDDVTGVGRGMAWCNDESNWPENVDAAEEIAEPRSGWSP